MSEKATFGLPKNIAAALSYVGMAFTGVLFYVFEREDKFVKFHALQSIIFFGALIILNIALSCAFGVLGIIPIVGILANIVNWFVVFGIKILTGIAWLFLIVSAATGKRFEIPVIGKIVSSQVYK